MNKAIQSALILAADFVVLAVTLVIFFVGFGFYEKTAIDYVGLGFVVFSELAFFIGAHATGRVQYNRVFVRVGVIATLSVYWVITTLISILYKPIFGHNVNGLVTVQVVVLALAALITIGIFSFSLRLKSIKEKTKD